MKTGEYSLSRDMAPMTLNLSTRRRSLISFTAQLLYPQYPLNGGPCGPRAGMDTENRKVPYS
jgi:hypothetical protein